MEVVFFYLNTYFCYIVEVHFIDRGKKRKYTTSSKTPTNFITIK
jgi:hypothetical protein